MLDFVPALAVCAVAEGKGGFLLSFCHCVAYDKERSFLRSAWSMDSQGNIVLDKVLGGILKWNRS